MSRLTTRELAVAALFTALLSVSAYIAIPIGSVPFTLQVFVVLLAGMVLGPRLGALSVVAYLVLGLVAPVYSGGTSGLGVLFGPTGGYLFGFIAAAVVTGLIAGRPDAAPATAPDRGPRGSRADLRARGDLAGAAAPPHAGRGRCRRRGAVHLGGHR